MHATETPGMHQGDLATPQRNHYFFGKLLDVFHFELETRYLNTKRWLVNRLVGGYGVVCGLDVQAETPTQIVVTSGVAIDRWGREIIVPHRTHVDIPMDLVNKVAQSCAKDEHPSLSVWLCYHECLGEPVPVLAGDCHSAETCAPGTIREQYRIDFRELPVPPMSPECRLTHVFCDRRIDYDALAKLVTKKSCPEMTRDPCIPLANIRFPKQEGTGYVCHHDNIDITIRPIVYTNDLLFELLLCVLGDTPEQRRAK